MRGKRSESEKLSHLLYKTENTRFTWVRQLREAQKLSQEAFSHEIVTIASV